MRHLGGVSFSRFLLRSHSWGRGMNDNLTKMAILLKGGVLSMTTPIPETGAINDSYIDPASGDIVMRVAAFDDGETSFAEDWVAITPDIGVHIYVADQQKFYVCNWHRDWEETVDLADSLPSVPRELSFYVPGAIRPSAIIFQYVAGIDIVFPNDNEHSGAVLDVAPSEPITFNINTSGGAGTITFAASSTDGVVDFASETEVYASLMDGATVTPNMLTISSPSDLKGAQGLTVTLRGVIEGVA